MKLATHQLALDLDEGAAAARARGLWPCKGRDR